MQAPVRDYFHLVRKTFEPFVRDAVLDKPVTYVEIGCWTAGSASCVAKYLTHPRAHGFGIDPYTALRKASVGKVKHDHPRMQQVKLEAAQKIAATGANWTWIYKPSIEALSEWTHGPIDVLYIDGLHESHSALLDFCLAWPWLNAGAKVIFDDTKENKHFGHVIEAVNAVQMCFGNLIERVPINTGKQAYFHVRSKDLDYDWWDDQAENGAWKHRQQLTQLLSRGQVTESST